MGAGISSGASENIFIMINRNCGFTEAGTGFNAGGQVKADNIGAGAGTGYTMGMNSG